MASPNIGRPGVLYNNGFGTDGDELFLKVFSGEIITSFEEANIMMPLHRVRTISSGKSATFAITGVASAQYHTPGESLLSQGDTTGYGNTTSNGATNTVTVAFDGGSAKYGTRFRHSEKIINIDDLLVASTFVADIDEMKNHYDVRSIYSKELGRALAYTADKNLIRTVIAGARKTTDRYGTASTTSKQYLGEQISLASLTTGGITDDLIAGLFVAAQKMDEKNVPEDGRYCVLTPGNYYKLVNGDGAKIAVNKDWGGNGDFSKGQVVEIAGIRILKSNHIPQTNETSTGVAPHNSTQIKNDVFGNNGVGYGAADFSTTQGIVFQTEGVGTVKLMDLSVDTDYITERLGTLMLAKYAMGHDVLRSECCFEFTT